jgi:hypothetical protein
MAQVLMPPPQEGLFNPRHLSQCQGQEVQHLYQDTVELPPQPPQLPPPCLVSLPGQQGNRMQQRWEDCPYLLQAISIHTTMLDLVTSRLLLRMARRARLHYLECRGRRQGYHQELPPSLLRRFLVSQPLVDIQRWSHRTRTLESRRVQHPDIFPTQRRQFVPASLGPNRGRRRRTPSC